ncbi:MAG: helix-turn-helix domain-containing protein [Kiritimatiellia bacterium]|nr:helix-turn-helix domain-containing protein [Kiritimatiellia bacterium]
MKIDSQMTDSVVLRELGGRLATVRIERNLTQALLAEQAGVAKRTVERLESGVVATQFSGFLRVCRALGLIERFEAFLPEPTPSPMAQLKRKGRKRLRVSVKRAARAPAKKWKWGDSA